MPKRASFSAVSFPKKPDIEGDRDDVFDEKSTPKAPNPFEVVEVQDQDKPIMHTVEEVETEENEVQEEEKIPVIPEMEREEEQNPIESKKIEEEPPTFTDLSGEIPAEEEDIKHPQEEQQEEPAPQPVHNAKTEVSDLFKKSQDRETLSPQEEFSKYPEITISEKDGLKPIVFWAIALVVAVCIIGAALLAMKRGTINQGVIPFIPRPTPTAVPTPTVAVTPTPTLPPIVKKDVKIKVLNGSGVTGAAKTLKTSLEEKGYSVPTATNADSSSYETTQIRVKIGKEYLIQLLTTELKGTYTVGDSKADLPKTSDVDAEITIGKS